jgi:hypothetical protein
MSYGTGELINILLNIHVIPNGLDSPMVFGPEKDDTGQTMAK